MNKKKPISQLTKQDFDEAYKELLVDYEGKWDKYPLPTKEEIINEALRTGQITMVKAIELYGKQ